MEIQETPDGASISLAFPLGLTLLVLLLLSMSCLFCCCLHWDKLRSLFTAADVMSNTELPVRVTDTAGSPHKPVPQLKVKKQDQVHSLPVLMPGDEFPKFVALPCPCQPLIMEKTERFQAVET